MNLMNQIEAEVAATDAEDNEAKRKRGSVVKNAYKVAYGKKGHCGDWLSDSLEGVFLNGERVFDTKLFEATLKRNGVELVGKWYDVLSSGQPGSEGRFRMNGRNKLARRVLETGKITLPAGTHKNGKQKFETEDADNGWLLGQLHKFPKAECAWVV